MSHGSTVLLAIAALLLAIATALGAYAAHGLDRILDAASLATFATGIDYQFYHALGLLGIAILRERATNDRALMASAALLITGIVLFSGSLYAGAFVSLGAFAFAAPLGGLCLITGWLVAAHAAWSLRGLRQ